MISPEEIKEKAVKIWNRGTILRAYCNNENIFPLIIPFKKAGGRGLLHDFKKVCLSIEKLISLSKKKAGFGYSIDFREVNHRQLGRQKIPDAIYFETLLDFLIFCRKKNEFENFKRIYLLTVNKYPELISFLAKKPLMALQYYKSWGKIILVSLFFRDNPASAIYLRQICLPEIDTKFIEKHKKIISEIMEFIYPEKYYNSSLSHNAFEKRFGLLYDQPLIRFRILDKNKKIGGLSDITLTLGEFIQWNPDINNIFITENKVNGLSLPEHKDSMVIFGLGYGIKILESVKWLKEKKIFYWGDIDTHGFSILNSFRQIFPQCISILMNEETLLSHRHAWVREEELKRFTGELTSLLQEEKDLYEKLRDNIFDINVRLEQELIAYDYVVDKILQKTQMSQDS